MKIYIGYKYQNVLDKEQLKQNLLKVSDALRSLGYETFILGRDAFNWNHHGKGSKSISPIMKNMKYSDVFLAIIECDSKSCGLLFESIFSKLKKKKMVIAIKKDLHGKPFIRFTRNIIEFENYEDLLRIISSDIDKYL